MNCGFVKTRFGWCGAIEEEGKIIRVYLPSPDLKVIHGVKTPLIESFLRMAVAYFDKMERVDFTVFPFKFTTSGEFAIKTYLWLIKNLKWGERITYGELARILNKPGGARAVGRVLRGNPLPLIVPCHRVVAKNGLGGFSASLSLKAEMLKIESSVIG